MGLLAWNYVIPDAPLDKKDLNKAGIILLIKDVVAEEAPGLGVAMRSGLIEGSRELEDTETE